MNGTFKTFYSRGEEISSPPEKHEGEAWTFLLSIEGITRGKTGVALEENLKSVHCPVIGVEVGK